MGKRQSNASGLARFLSVLQDTATTTDAAAGSATAVKSLSETTATPPSGRLKRPAPSRDQSHAAKRRKAAILDSELARYDASGLAHHYTDASQVPEHLQKYFSQRHRYFTRYSEGCLLDEVGWYSVTPELIADQIAERCRSDCVLDAFCGVGGNAIAFAKTCQRVIALDTSPTRLALARHNAAVYGVADRIDFILADYLSFARAYLARPRSRRAIDVVFLSPPWGGPGYLSTDVGPAEATPVNEADSAIARHPEYTLATVQPVHGAELFELTRRITPNVAYFLPRNTSLAEISGLLLKKSGASAGPSKSQEHVEVEEEWMDSKLKALTCYFGGLVTGQEHLFEERPV